jgi:hypothetical protein
VLAAQPIKAKTQTPTQYSNALPDELDASEEGEDDPDAVGAEETNEASGIRDMVRTPKTSNRPAVTVAFDGLYFTAKTASTALFCLPKRC